MFVLYIIIIDCLNEILISFQISLHIGQRFLNQYYLRTDEIFFSNSPRVMNPLLITQVPSYNLCYTQCLTFRYIN